MEYIGNELELFEHAYNWKKYYAQNILKHIKGNVLEVGAGIGANTRFLINKEVISWTYVEPDPILFSKIEPRNSNINTSQKFINGKIDDVIDTNYDCIIYIDVLEHIEFPKLEIKKIKDKLADNGKLIILVPAYQSLYSEFDKKIGHFRRYNKKMLSEDINNELKTVDLFYLDSLGLLASIANKYILKKEIPSLDNVFFWDKKLIPCSKIADLVIRKKIGKSLIGIYKK